MLISHHVDYNQLQNRIKLNLNRFQFNQLIKKILIRKFMKGLHQNKSNDVRFLNFYVRFIKFYAHLILVATMHVQLYMNLSNSQLIFFFLFYSHSRFCCSYLNLLKYQRHWTNWYI